MSLVCGECPNLSRLTAEEDGPESERFEYNCTISDNIGIRIIKLTDLNIICIELFYLWQGGTRKRPRTAKFGEQWSRQISYETELQTIISAIPGWRTEISGCAMFNVVDALIRKTRRQDRRTFCFFFVCRLLWIFCHACVKGSEKGIQCRSPATREVPSLLSERSDVRQIA